MKIVFSKNILAAGFALAMALAFGACDGGKSSLADRWLLVEGPAKGNPEDMELLKDGTGIIDKAGIKWKTEGGRFYMTHPLMAKSYGYKAQGSMLTLIDDDGDTLVYKTKKAIEAAYAARLSKGAVSANPLKDSRDGKSYKAVKMGEQTWMAENLSFDAEGSECYWNKPENCQKYGRLYNWETALKACPAGWHLPTNKEWDALYRYADGTSGTESPYKSETAGKHLKAKEGWNDNEGKSGNGLDSYGFAALPGGLVRFDGSFGSAGYEGHWWSASWSGSSHAYYRDMGYRNESADWSDFYKALLFSVRCLQD